MCSLSWNCPAHRTIMDWAALGFQSSVSGNISCHKSSWGKVFSTLHELGQCSHNVQTLLCPPAWISVQGSAQSLCLALLQDVPLGLLCPYAPSSFPLRAGDTQEAATCSSEPAKSKSSKKVGGFWQRRATSKHSPVSPCQKGFWNPSCSVLIYFCSKESFPCAY